MFFGKHLVKLKMNFLFGKKEPANSKPSVESIKSTLENYRFITEITEIRDYNVGDYIVRKPEADTLKIYEDQPSICYVLSITVEEDGVTVAYWDKDHINIRSVTYYLYKKAPENQPIPGGLDEFVVDKSIAANVSPGTYVRVRQNHDLYYHPTMLSLSKKIYTPSLVAFNENGEITIVGCVKNQASPIKIQVHWYELAPYLE